MEGCSVCCTVNYASEQEHCHDARTVRLLDGRTVPQTLDGSGFELARGVVSLEALDQLYHDGVGLHRHVIEVVYPQVEEELARRLHASKVMPFDHVFRRGESLEDLPGAETAHPLRWVHNDYTLDSGYIRARMHLTEHSTEQGLADALRQRLAIVNVWAPLRAVRRDPLGMIDFRSTEPGDVQVQRFIFETDTFPVRDTYCAHYNPKHEWVYFPDMEPGECVLLKTFDSSSDAEVAKMALHACCTLPEQEMQPERESLEIRCLVFYGELEEGFGSGFVPPPGQSGQPGGDVMLSMERLPRCASAATWSSAVGDVDLSLYD